MLEEGTIVDLRSVKPGRYETTTRYEPSLRDQFAMAALHGIARLVGDRKDFNDHEIAAWAYSIADAMIDVRKEADD